MSRLLSAAEIRAALEYYSIGDGEIADISADLAKERLLKKRVCRKTVGRLRDPENSIHLVTAEVISASIVEVLNRRLRRAGIASAIDIASAVAEAA